VRGSGSEKNSTVSNGAVPAATPADNPKEAMERLNSGRRKFQKNPWRLHYDFSCARKT